MRVKLLIGLTLAILTIGCNPSKEVALIAPSLDGEPSRQYHLLAKGGIPGKPADRPKPKPTKTPKPMPSPSQSPSPCPGMDLDPISLSFWINGFNTPSSSLDEVVACRTIHLVNQHTTQDAIGAVFPGSSLDNPLNRTPVIGPFSILANDSYDFALLDSGGYYLEVYYSADPSTRFQHDITVVD